MSPSNAPIRVSTIWRERLRHGGSLGEVESLKLLSDFGIPTAAARHAQSLDEALAAATSLGYPVALKTAAPGIHHKSDVGGVKLGITDAEELAKAWRDLAARLGPAATVEPMIAAGVELAFGAVADPQFGPLVMVGAGGSLVEVLNDRCFALAPFDAAEALRLIDRLRMRRLLDGVRGAPPVNIDALAKTLAKFSVLAVGLAGCFSEIDVNPVIADRAGATAVDALIVRCSVDSEVPSYNGI
jgi:hypothetical protein